jgi:hypothetical protein
MCVFSQDFGYILLQAQKDFEKVRQRLDAIPLEAVENDLVRSYIFSQYAYVRMHRLLFTNAHVNVEPHVFSIPAKS